MPIIRCRQYMLIILAGVLFAGRAQAQGPAITLTGWFACHKCSTDRVARGEIRPTNPVCSRECIEKGDEAVFLSEQGKQLLKVKKYDWAPEDLGYHLEVTGTIDRAGGTITIDSVKRLSFNGSSCARPRGTTKR